MKFHGAFYSKSIKCSLPSDRVYHRCLNGDLKRVECKGKIEFGEDRKGRTDFNKLLDYHPHTRRCEYYHANASLERLLRRSRNSSVSEQRSQSWSSNSRDYHGSSKERIGRNGDAPEPKENQDDDQEPVKQERSEMFDLFKCMYDFESSLKSLIQYSRDEKNRPFLEAKIGEYREDFGRLLGEFRTRDALDKLSVSAELISSSAPASPTSDLRSIAKLSLLTAKLVDSMAEPVKEASPECRSPVGRDRKPINPDDPSYHCRNSVGKLQMQKPLDPSDDRFEVLDDGRINFYI